MTCDADVIVVGGGLAGTAAAVAIARLGLQTLHLAPPAPPDRRTSALMMPSVDFLQRAGLIAAPAEIGHPLTRIRIIDATSRLIRAPETLFDAAEAGLFAFGWNFPNARLLEAFSASGPKETLETQPHTAASFRRDEGMGILTLDNGEELKAPLIVAADGKKSMLRGAAGIVPREHPFTEAALVCDLRLARPIGTTSIEFHYPHGPFTLVAAGDDRANLVWIDEESVLRAAQAGGPEHLRSAILAKSQRLFGTIEVVSPSFVFPLSVLSVTTAGRDGVALVGEAAHAFPPIGAQGLNLGLRDVAGLVSALEAVDREQHDWAEKVILDYSARRMGDLASTGAMVEGLFRSLLADMVPAQLVRASGLWALKSAPPLRRAAFQLGMGARRS
ncbi:FAD-dependent monooxygenase [Devosia sp. PTR5]|uniref:FAD-dependent monooxygenase n=1 Tax=Devosia oryzisoli TaxID=2774138 RepID=A0A927FRC7_9HYPH|nr:FAD-dependent monooxygenase [Devosia oryzisoli]MBD8064825.1 FAD-dependent monooxygenase [Devosia oryzisoli]